VVSEVTIRVFIGTSCGEDAEAQAVCEYTLRRHASRPLDITWLMLSHEPGAFGHGWNTHRWGTPFSGLRYGVPALCDYRGKAIYLDTDIIVRADIAELWDQEIPSGAMALVKGEGLSLRSCVMLIDCEAARRPLPSLAVMKRTSRQNVKLTDMLRARPGLTAPFEGMWNCVDLKDSEGIDDPRVKLIHYSSQWEQPHLRHAAARLARQGRRHWFDGPTMTHRHAELQALFDELLIEAAAAGFSPERYEPAEPFGRYAIRSYANRLAA
jgi:hypothetical protein